MNSENIIAVNVPNIITIGLMFFGFTVFLGLVSAAARKLTGSAKPAEEAADA